MTEELTVDTVMTRRFQLADEIDEVSRRHKVELEPLKSELELCETFIKSEMNKGNMQQLKIRDVGMAFFTTKSKCVVEDFEAALAEIKEKGLWHMLTKAVSKEAVKDYIEEYKETPPGVRFEQFKDLSWRR